jgi:hypothetical protein
VIVIANNYLAGALISLLIPAAVLVSVAVWYTRIVLRREREREGATAAPAEPLSRDRV